MERRPGRDEQQLVRGAAGGLAHRATRHTTLFAPGAGAPTTEFARRSTASVRLGVPVTLAPPAGVRTRGGCSYKAATPERGETHRVRSRPVGSTFPGNVYPSRRSAPALRQPEPVQPREGRAPARPPLTPQPTPTAHALHRRLSLRTLLQTAARGAVIAMA